MLAADRIVLPGVGAFADCKAGVDAVAGMREALEKTVRERLRPFLGICVGAQLMAERGLEFRITPGFGWIKGDVKAIEPNDPALKIPHMGWNTLDVSTTIRCWPASRPGRWACTPISCTPSTWP